MAAIGQTDPLHSDGSKAALGGSDNGSSSRTLWIGDLAYYCDEAFLSSVFANTNALLSVKVIRNKTTQMSEGYGFLEFSSHESAQHVLNSLNGKLIPGTDQIFRLNWAAFGVGKSADGDSPDHSVFVGDLAADVTDYILQENFRRYFPSVRSAKVITDPMTGRSKGYGFVRFGNEQERDRALGEMMGHFISNRPIRVSIATAKKNPTGLSANAVAAGIPHPSDFDPTNTTLFIGGLSAAVSEEDLRTVFGQYGDIIYTKIPPGKGCGFVQFVQRAAAETAMSAMQGKVIGSSAIRLSWGRSSTASRPTAVNPASSYTYPGASFPGSAAFGSYSGGYGGYGGIQPGGNSGIDPYAAYSYALNQQAGGIDPAIYQAYQQQQAAALAAASGQLGGRGNHSSLHGLAAQQHSRPEQVDPLGSLDIDRLNISYMHRNQNSLLGALTNAPSTTSATGIGN